MIEQYVKSRLALLGGWPSVSSRIVRALGRSVEPRLAATRQPTGRHRSPVWFITTGWVNAFKAFRGCYYCVEQDPACLDLHHRDRSTKSTEVSQLVNGHAEFPLVQHEASKCEVVCANCHRKKHYQERYQLGAMMARREPSFVVVD